MNLFLNLNSILIMNNYSIHKSLCICCASDRFLPQIVTDTPQIKIVT